MKLEPAEMSVESSLPCFLHYLEFSAKQNVRLNLRVLQMGACSRYLNVKKAFETRALLCLLEGWGSTWDQHILLILPNCHAVVS